jgi:hypothetical protein
MLSIVTGPRIVTPVDPKRSRRRVLGRAAAEVTAAAAIRRRLPTN